jgi:hypothetical protein
MARAGAEAKALILLLTFFPQCVVSMLSMTPPVMASQIALSLGLSPQIAGPTPPGINATSPMPFSKVVNNS